MERGIRHKNLAVTSHIRSISSGGSKRAEDMAMKIDWLRATHGSRVATFATATPITNSVAEVYVMQRHLQPDTLRAAGVEHFDGWAANFARTVTALELAPDASTYRMNTRFARFANVPDLLTMFRQTADVRTGDQLRLRIPDLVGGRPETVVVDAPEDLRMYVGSLAARAEAIRNGAVRPEDDNMLKVSGDGRKAALDLRLVGLPADPAGGKVAVAADRIAAIHRDTAAAAYLDSEGVTSPRRGALQLVFCDLGTPHGDDRWTVYDQLRVELIARGVPGEAVAFIHDARNDAEKARLFAACRAGTVAVLIGSTEKMGVGTNVQARAVALHHLDCPWRPADLEQRDGRILRQGNQNPEVRIIRYVTEGSFDVFSWQTVERKAAFINQIMRGDVTERSIDDVGDQALSYAEVKALATGNPLIMERAGVDSELTKLERLHASYRDEQASLARRVRTSERDVAEAETTAAAYHAAAARAADTTGDRFAMVVDDHRHIKRAEAATALQVTVLREQKQMPIGERRAVRVGELAGFAVVATIARDSTETSAQFSLAGVPGHTPTINRDELRAATPLGVVTRLENLARDLPARADQAGERAAHARREAAKAAGRIGQPFEHAGRIASLRDRLSAIDAELAPPEPVSGADDTSTVPASPASVSPGPQIGTVYGGPRRGTPATPPREWSSRDRVREQVLRRRAEQRPSPGFER